MSQLLIVTLSIALMAVLLFVGGYYGGEAWHDSEAKAKASHLVAGVQQVAQSWQAYAERNMGDYTLTDTNWSDGSVSDLTPAYLSQLPAFPFATYAGRQYYPYMIEFSGNGFTPDAATSNAIGVSLDNSEVSQEICKQINQMAAGTAAVGTSDWAGYASTAAAMNDLKPFYCAADITNSAYHFYYRVF